MPSNLGKQRPPIPWWNKALAYLLWYTNWLTYARQTAHSPNIKDKYRDEIMNLRERSMVLTGVVCAAAFFWRLPLLDVLFITCIAHYGAGILFFHHVAKEERQMFYPHQK